MVWALQAVWMLSPRSRPENFILIREEGNVLKRCEEMMVITQIFERNSISSYRIWEDIKVISIGNLQRVWCSVDMGSLMKAGRTLITWFQLNYNTISFMGMYEIARVKSSDKHTPPTVNQWLKLSTVCSLEAQPIMAHSAICGVSLVSWWHFVDIREINSPLIMRLAIGKFCGSHSDCEADYRD